MTDWIDAIDWSARAREDAEAESAGKAMVKKGSLSVGEVNISIGDYHASERVSSSKLKTFMDLGPYAYYVRHVLRNNELKQSDIMRLGQAFEDKVCGRKTFHVAEFDGRTKAGKAEKAAHQDAIAEGLIWVSASHSEFMDRGHKHLVQNRAAMKLINSCSEQPTLYAPWRGLAGIQARPDWGNADGVFPDLKTTSTLEAFARNLPRSHYHLQAAIVRMCARHQGIKDTRHPLIVVEREWPYRCQVMELHEDYLEIGESIVERELTRMSECYRTEDFGLCEEQIVLSPPRWLAEKE